jgi:hypothetical protein
MHLLILRVAGVVLEPLVALFQATKAVLVVLDHLVLIQAAQQLDTVNYQAEIIILLAVVAVADTVLKAVLAMSVA